MKKFFETLITPDELLPHLNAPDWVIVDARFNLADANSGYNDYLTAHIPGAVYAHLNDDLSAPMIPGQTGRHPLPNIENAATLFGSLGISPGVQVVAYDDQGGALAAARLWWMLRWLGHSAVAVLDGGYQAWQVAQLPYSSGPEQKAARKFTSNLRSELVYSSLETRV
jgi:thiosulfate/3-mercaptopyruvate sulfurtransferase